jgi:hypothetical protein
MCNALRALADDNHEDVVRVTLASTGRQYFDEDLTPHEPLGVEVMVAFVDEPEPRALRRILEPFLRRRTGRLDRVEVNAQADIYVAWVTVAPPRKVSTLREGYEFAEEVATLVSSVDGGEITHASALALIRSGRADLLFGQPEGEWLDAKRLPYALAQDEQKYELAKDAAAFANGGGGLVVLGLATVAAQGAFKLVVPEARQRTAGRRSRRTSSSVSDCPGLSPIPLLDQRPASIEA